MGKRKHNMAEELRELRTTTYIARLQNCPTSPRKMRLVADLIRGMEVDRALEVLRYCPKESARRLEKTVLSAIAGWQVKNEGKRVEDAKLYIGKITVDSARQLKRIRPAPHGRAHRISKRSNHVTVILHSAQTKEIIEVAKEAEKTVIV